MNSPCDRLPEFIDGDLPASELPAMVAHLETCLECQQSLDDTLQFDALSRFRTPKEPEDTPSVGTWMRRAAVSIVLVALGAGGPPLLAELRYDSDAAIAELLKQTHPEQFSVRIYGGALDAFRDYAPNLAAGPSTGASLPAAEIGQLEARGKIRAVAALYLFEGSPERAAAYLDSLSWTPDVGSDRAAVYITQGEHERALDELDRVLLAAPKHERALYNRALALRELGLGHQAAQAFEDAAVLGSDAWAEAATQNAQTIREQLDPWRTAWFAVFEAGERWIANREPIPGDLIDRVPGLSRFYFYAAAQSADSAVEVERLRPAAERLEAQHGDSALTDYLDRLAREDFRKRAPLARTFRRLWKRELSDQEVDAFLATLERSGASDILMGALYRTKRMNDEPERFAALAAEQNDPWAELVALRVSSMALAQSGKFFEAAARLRAGITRSRYDYRTADLQNELTRVYRELHLTVEAENVGRRALELTRATHEWDQHSKQLIELANVAMYRRQFGAMRAMLEEYMSFWPRSARAEQTGREYLAMRHIYLGQASAAVEMLRGFDALSTIGAWALVDAYRFGDTGLTAEFVADRLRNSADDFDDPGRAVLRKMLEGRLAADANPQAGRDLLEEAIQAADDLPLTDSNAQKGRAHALLTLAILEGERGLNKAALTVIARQVRASVPDTCTIGAAADDQRTLVVGRDEQGNFFGHYERKGLDSILDLDASAFVPRSIQARLARCAFVEVFAHPPLAGAPNLLPETIAWAYRLGPRQGEIANQSGTRLVVSNAILSPTSDGPLQRLPSLTLQNRDAAVHLQREAATPTRVLAAMRHAGEIEFYTHGYLNLGSSEASMLALSRDVDGRDALTAHDIEQQQLEGRPVVFLGACKASLAALAHHATFGLPAAFLKAGARAVFASPETIPADEAAEVFGEIRRAIRGGAQPGEALRSVRLRRMQDNPQHWSRHILLFVS
ncbi:MAG: CHAT domain-containing protein [Deltaproteobacteria bacterium]